MLAYLATTIICAATAQILVSRKTYLRKVKWKEIVDLVRQSSVFFYSSMSYTINTAGATYVLSVLASPEEVGFFGPAERMITFGVSLLGPLAQVLLPTIAALQAEASQRAVLLARKGLLLELSFGLVVLIIGLPAAPYVVPLILGTSFVSTIHVLQILLLMLPLVSFKHALGHYFLIPLKKEKIFLASSTTNMCLSIGLAFLTVPLWGAVGMAVARLLGEIGATSVLLSLALKAKLFKKESFAKMRPNATAPMANSLMDQE
jgi:PST family polysaccharide transporter